MFLTELATAFQESATRSSSTQGISGKRVKCAGMKGKDFIWHKAHFPSATSDHWTQPLPHLSCVTDALQAATRKTSSAPRSSPASRRGGAQRPWPQTLASAPARSAGTTAGAVGRSGHGSGLIAPQARASQVAAAV